MQAVFFDLDGTLLDTLEDLAASANHAIGPWGLGPHETEAYRAMIGDGAEKLIRRALGEAHEHHWVEALDAFKAHYARHMTDRSRPYDGVEPMLDALAASGATLAILSNKPHLAARQVVEATLGRWNWAAVIGQREGVPIKPDPTAVRLLAEQLDVPADRCLFVGDMTNDILAGRGAGMRTVGVTWGLRGREELTEAGADHLIDHPSELLNLCRGASVE